MVWLESADVTLQYLCPQTGTCQRSSVVKATRVGFCLDETDRRVLTVGRDRALQEWAVQGGVRVHNRFMEHGKLTLHLVKRNLQLLLSNADPAQLRAWCRALAGPPAPRGEEPAKRPLGASSTLNTPAVSPAGRSKKPRDFGEAPAQTPAPSAAPAPPALSPGTASSLTDEQQAVLRAALGGAVALIPTFYYGNHGSFVLRTRPWLANATNGVLFYFRNDKRGDQQCGARGACGGRPTPHDCERTCLAGACAEASLPNLPDEVADFAAALPAGHPLHIGLYFSAYSHCPAPSPTYVRAALNASLSLPSVAGATVDVQQRPAGPWTPAFCAANPDDKGCIVRDVFGQFA